MGIQMPITKDDILTAALALTESERAEIAERLLRTLDGPEPTPEEQAEIDAAWVEEIERRAQEIDEGKSHLIPGDEIMRRLRAGLRP